MWAVSERQVSGEIYRFGSNSNKEQAKVGAIVVDERFDLNWSQCSVASCRAREPERRVARTEA